MINLGRYKTKQEIFLRVTPNALYIVGSQGLETITNKRVQGAFIVWQHGLCPCYTPKCVCSVFWIGFFVLALTSILYLVLRASGRFVVHFEPAQCSWRYTESCSSKLRQAIHLVDLRLILKSQSAAATATAGELFLTNHF